MKERPILFSAPMVRAILAGTKTQTRRVVKPQPGPYQWIEECVGGGWVVIADGEPTCGSGVWDTRERAYQWQIKSPFARGDELWVRETHSLSTTMMLDQCVWVWYWADGNPTHGDWTRPRPSIHMPRWASRILLEVTSVRVERLQDISDADAIAEGVERVVVGEGWRRYHDDEVVGLPPCATARDSYRALWEQINGPGSWDANPWVWVVKFRRIES